MIKRVLKGFICALLVLILTFSDIPEMPVEEAQAAELQELQNLFAPGTILTQEQIDAYLDSLPPKRLFLEEVKKLALSKSKKYKKIKRQIRNKQVKYTDAVKRIKAKKKKLSTFSWTPLLNFKFPTDPSFTEEFEFYYKPIEIQMDIKNLKHKLTDEIYATYEKAINLYVQAYTLQEKIAYSEKLLKEKKKTLEKNEARLAMGLANESDVKAIKKAINKLEKKIATDGNSFMNKKNKLGKMIGIEIRSRYTFVNPYMEAEIGRDQLENIINYTVENNQAVFEARSNTALAQFTLSEYYILMTNRYGSKMDAVSQFVTMAQNGEEIDGDALLDKFEKLLEDIDAKWEGKLKILFIKIPKLWFKGATAGSRYIEDEPYALYNAILDLGSAKAEEESTIEETREEVKDAFENLKQLETTYKNDKENLAEQEKELELALVKNQYGLMTFEEYTELQDEYETSVVDANADLDAYTQALSSFDRLTCGYITKLLVGAGIDAEDIIGGDSYLIAETVEGMSYYIKVQPEANIFELGLHIPDDYEVEVTHFELWIDNIKVAKEKVENNIRHLGFELDGSETVFLRFYNDKDMICDVTIDPSQYYGEIDLITGYVVKKIEQSEITLGTYTMKKNDATDMVEFTFTADASLEGAQTYKLLSSSGLALAETETQSGQPMTYLSLLEGSISNITVVVLDGEGNELAKGSPDPETMTVKGTKEGGDA